MADFTGITGDVHTQVYRTFSVYTDLVTAAGDIGTLVFKATTILAFETFQAIDIGAGLNTLSITAEFTCLASNTITEVLLASSDFPIFFAWYADFSHRAVFIR